MQQNDQGDQSFEELRIMISRKRQHTPPKDLWISSSSWPYEEIKTERKDNKEFKVLQGLQEQKVIKVIKEYKEHKEFKAHKEFRVI